MEIGEVLGRTLFKGVSGMNHCHIYDCGLLRLSTKRLTTSLLSGRLRNAAGAGRGRSRPSGRAIQSGYDSRRPVCHPIQ
jgi:hypothetical protein